MLTHPHRSVCWLSDPLSFHFGPRGTIFAVFWLLSVIGAAYTHTRQPIRDAGSQAPGSELETMRAGTERRAADRGTSEKAARCRGRHERRHGERGETRTSRVVLPKERGCGLATS